MIRFDHITKQYPGTNRPALNDIDLEILRGEFVFLVGASGSGKSSCLRLVLKEEKPTSGSIHVMGQDLRRISNRKVPYFRRNLGVVFQDFRLLPNKSVYDNVAFSLQVIGKSRGFIQEAVPDTLKMVGLAEKAQRLPHELSGGEQQRVAIARAIVNKPQILLADEPTGNLDPTTSADIMALLERINAGGTTVVMATHEAGIVDKMQRRVIELASGQIIRDERQGGYVTTSIPIPRSGTGSAPAPDARTGAAAPAADNAEPEPIAEPIAETKTGAEAVPGTAAGTQPELIPVPSAVDSTPYPTAAAQYAPASEYAPAAPVTSPALTAPLGPAASLGAELKPAPASSYQSSGAVPEPVVASLAETASDQPAPQPAFAPPMLPPAAEPPSRRHAAGAAPVPAQAGDSGGDEPGTAAAAGLPPAPDGVPTAARPVLPTAQHDVPEQLTLAEKLGLRAPGERPDHTGEQNVGPTR
jgi:cell division transport system ATP-binding protein